MSRIRVQRKSKDAVMDYITELVKKSPGKDDSFYLDKIEIMFTCGRPRAKLYLDKWDREYSSFIGD